MISKSHSKQIAREILRTCQRTVKTSQYGSNENQPV
jgi:hypothetical protein